jgi:(1->4)-alpha-D-glucan 1-alpha-D-glucosylmutase
LNPWWRDVLQHGPASPFARFFDIDWQPLKRELENKVLLPVFEEQFGRILESDGFRVAFGAGEFLLVHRELTLPLGPRTIRPFLQRAVEMLAPAPPELESIVTAIEHLPSRTETAAERITERVRESRIIRERLLRLCGEAPAVAEAVQRVMNEWNDPADASRFDRLDALIGKQPYRLSSWRVAGQEINYRRFFDVNSLAAIRMELPEVFDATHRLLFELIDAGHVTGVRIDHIDGLAFPRDYLIRLRERGGASLYLLVEKILGANERLRADWPVDGTTGYEFTNQLTQLLVSAPDMPQMAAVYEKFAGFRPDYREIAYRGKRLVMESSMASELNVLGHLLSRLAQSHRWYRDFTVNSLTAAVREVVACFPVYRTYLDPAQPAGEFDIRTANRALSHARRRNRALEPTVFEFLREVLLPPKDNPHPVDENLRRIFVLKFQQCTGPIAAKGVEDTAFYGFNRLIALNEVGGEPDAMGLSVEQFHRHNAARLAEIPHCLLTTSTHDTKRSEDVRARIAAISELPEEWGRAVRRWQMMNRKHRHEFDGEPAPDANEEYLLYQTLAGAWPLDGLHDGNRAEFRQRIQDYMVKAVREAKVNSSWLEPNVAWEDAVRAFTAALLAPGGRNRFPQSFATFAKHIARPGMVNSLTQTALKLTCPGVADFYQGCEVWDFSLVDPDNRRPVDYASRQRQLDSLSSADPGELLENWPDGRIKLFLIHRLLALRRERKELFASGSYTAIAAAGLFADKVVTFERRGSDAAILVVVPRLTARLGFPPLRGAWADTQLALPGSSTWRDIFTGREHQGNTLAVSGVLADLPFAVLWLLPAHEAPA